MLWIVKYRPKKLDDVVGNTDSIERIKKWMESWSTGKKPLLLVGPPGVGKTASVLAAAKEYGLELLELNASDDRSREKIESVLRNATETTTFSGKKRLILIDEVDGMEISGARALAKMIEGSRQPIILTANDLYSSAVYAIKNLCDVVQFRRVNYRILASYLAKILEYEGIAYEKDALLELARKENGDIRSALLDLQAIAEKKGKISIKDIEIIGDRDRETNIFNVLSKIFKSEKVVRPFTLTATLDVDPSLLKAWIVENIPKEYEKKDEVSRAFHWVSIADVFEGRISKRQHWGFLAYAQEILINGVIVSKDKPYRKFTQYSFPSWIKKRSQYKLKKEKIENTAKKICKVLHISKKEFLEQLPFLRIILSNPEVKEAIRRKARLTEDELSAIGV